MLHSDNDVRSVMVANMQCPSSTNYRCISYKYNVYDHEWYGDINKLMGKSVVSKSHELMVLLDYWTMYNSW